MDALRLSPKNKVLSVGMLTLWNVETPVVFSPTTNVSDLTFVVFIPAADTLVKELPSPTNFNAVTIPVYVADPVVSTVTPVPTWMPLVVAVSYTHLTLPTKA